MPGRILGGLCGNVRLFSVPPPPPSLTLSFSLRVVLSFVLFFFLFFFVVFFFLPSSSSSSFANLSFFSIWADSTIRSSLASTPPFALFAPFARSSSSSRLPAFGYHLGHRGHPPRCTRYVVCPIFTHGKSTLKRRWTPARSSSLLRCRAPARFAPLLSCATRLLLNKRRSR